MTSSPDADQVQTDPLLASRGSAPTAPPPPSEPVTIKKVTLAAVVGTFIEQFDSIAYGGLAVIIAKVFFPSQSAATGLLSALAVFAVGFFARPLGGLIWGPVGDRIGRKRTMVLNITLMTIATTLVGLLPTYAMIGVWAPVLLITLRFLQGMSTGGEIPGAAIFIGEYARTKRRGLQTSFLQFATSGAELVAILAVTGLVAGLSEDALDSWGWRIPFLLAAPMGLIGLYIRFRLEETPVFEQIAAEGAKSRHPLKTVLGSFDGWKMVGRAALFILPVLTTGYLLLTFMPAFLTESAGLSRTASVVSVVIAQVSLIIALPIGGHLSDRLGRRPMLLIGSALQFVVALPAFGLLQMGGRILPVLGLMLLAFPFGLARGVQLAAVLESFPTRVRFTGFAFTLGVLVCVVSGPTPYLAQWLVTVTGNMYSPAWIIMATVLAPLLLALRVEETANRPLAQ